MNMASTHRLSPKDKALANGLPDCVAVTRLPERNVTWIPIGPNPHPVPTAYGTTSSAFSKDNKPFGLFPATFHTSNGPLEVSVMVDILKQGSKHVAYAYGSNMKPSIRGAFYITCGHPGNLKGIGPDMQWVCDEIRHARLGTLVKVKNGELKMVDALIGLDVNWCSLEVGQ